MRAALFDHGKDRISSACKARIRSVFLAEPEASNAVNALGALLNSAAYWVCGVAAD
jgi:hypothetical protein